MSIDERGQQPSILQRYLNRDPELSGRPELVWTEDFSKRAGTGATIAEPVPTATLEPAPYETTSAAQDALAQELATQRTHGLEELYAELRLRRAEFTSTLERQRAEAAERIATVERLEREAIACRREAVDRGSEQWGAEQQRIIVERTDAAIAAEIGQLDQRRQHADARMREQIEARRREEVIRLEAWRVSEFERIDAELATEEQRFNERLLHQLKEFEFQLGERMREQEECLARRTTDAERLAHEHVAKAFDNVFPTEVRQDVAGAQTT